LGHRNLDARESAFLERRERFATDVSEARRTRRVLDGDKELSVPTDITGSPGNAEVEPKGLHFPLDLERRRIDFDAAATFHRQHWIGPVPQQFEHSGVPADSPIRLPDWLRNREIALFPN